MLRSVERSSDMGPLSLCPFCLGCIIATRGYDFWEGQGVTAHPSAEWIAHQLTEAYGWQQAPRYIVRDRDCVYGYVFTRRVRAMGIREPKKPQDLITDATNGIADLHRLRHGGRIRSDQSDVRLIDDVSDGESGKKSRNDQRRNEPAARLAHLGDVRELVARLE
jgi:hypothetical protein